jgi:hypothetical protein
MEKRDIQNSKREQTASADAAALFGSLTSKALLGRRAAELKRSASEKHDSAQRSTGCIAFGRFPAPS